MDLWGRVFAAGYDCFLAPAERTSLGRRRAAMLAGLSGRVLELGAGTGANVPHYPRGLAQLVLSEPHPPMARRLHRRVQRSELAAEVVHAPGEALPFNDGAFDAVVVTMVLCSVADPGRTLAEIRRVLRAEGTLHFFEHVRAREGSLAGWQDRLAPVWRAFGHGCRCNQDAVALIQAAGFVLVELERGEIPGAFPLVRPLAAGVASAPRTPRRIAS